MRPVLAFLLFVLSAVSVVFSAYSTSSSYSTFGKSVSLNLAFNINGRANDNLTYGNDFVAAASPDVTLGITSPNAFGTRYDVNYSSTDYIIEMKSPLKDARFFVVFTQGNSTAISNRIESVKRGMPGKTFGNFNLTVPQQTDIFLRLAYSNVNIIGRLYLGPGSRKIEIRNEGRDDKGVTNVTLQTIR